MKIPQCDPQSNYLAYQAEIDAAIHKVLDSGWYVLGQTVLEFEHAFAEAHQCQFGVGVGNGTDALEISLRALGVGHDDLVATVSHTAVATVSAICRTGATPVFVDVGKHDYPFSMDPESLDEVLSHNDIKAVVVVHLYGHPAPIAKICELAAKFEVPVIEDCAQAHGAKVDNKPVGSFGALACFSFYPTKNLGALGDGGMILTSDESFHEACLLQRQYGWQEDRSDSKVVGVNSRLDEVQAAVLLAKLPHLDEMTRQRQRIANAYDQVIQSCAAESPPVPANTEPVFHQYVIRVFDRQAAREALLARGIQTAMHYPLAVHQQTAFLNHSNGISLPNTEAAVAHILSLPMYPELSDQALRHILTALPEVLG